jgi:hypothetical protein
LRRPQRRPACKEPRDRSDDHHRCDQEHADARRGVMMDQVVDAQGSVPDAVRRRTNAVPDRVEEVAVVSVRVVHRVMGHRVDGVIRLHVNSVDLLRASIDDARRLSRRGRS